nr:tetratricopeptide repeat protein [Streptomyces gossypiisoli]
MPSPRGSPGSPVGEVSRGDCSTCSTRLRPAVVPRGCRCWLAALSGLGGIGKTALAVEAAHAACAKGCFPGGVLFLDLRGYDDDPVTGDQALEALLRALGTEPDHIPAGVEERAALYRSVLAERGRERGPLLVVADNASSSEQVRRLLPGEARHRLLVTSRTKLPQLGARLLPLGELTPQEAYDLLDRALRIADPADRRAAQEPEAVRDVSARCGHLPLALGIAAALLVLDRDKPVAELADELAELLGRLAHLDDGERSVRAAFDVTYRRLPAEQARLLRLMAVAPGADVSTEVAAVLVGADTPPIRDLNALARTHLVERGSMRGRWRLHDLVRAFGVALVEEDPQEGEAAREHLLAFYGARARAAADWVRWLPGNTAPMGFSDRTEALGWMDAERTGLVAAVQWADEGRFAVGALGLADGLGEYLEWRRFFDDWITVTRVALQAASRLGSRRTEAGVWNDHGIALRRVGRVEEAMEAFTRARDLHQELEADPDFDARTWNNLGNVLGVSGRTAEAIDALTRARDLYGTLGDQHREAFAWNNLGNALQEAGRAEEAIDALTNSWRLYEEVGDRHGQGMALNNLGVALGAEGRMGEAMEVFTKALAIRREFDDWYGIGTTLGNLGIAHQISGDTASALASYLQAAEAFTSASALTDAAQCRTRAGELTP